MSFGDFATELTSIYTREVEDVTGVTSLQLDDALRRLNETVGHPRSLLYDELAEYLARGFHEGQLQFEFCDAIVNDVHVLITTAGKDRPELFWSVYLAFDDGEYCHGNNFDEDPIEVYTRPAIAQVLKYLASRGHSAAEENRPNS